jgi:hypothetical protein
MGQEPEEMLMRITVVTSRTKFLCLIILAMQLSAEPGPGQDVRAAEVFRVTPYLQNPAPDAMTVRWLSEENAAGTIAVTVGEQTREFLSVPRQPAALAYNVFGPEPGDRHTAIPFLHSIRITDLEPGTKYSYQVRQSGSEFSGTFRTTPSADQPVRFVVYSDPETEPESTTSPPVAWPSVPASGRPKDIGTYFVNQTTGYQQNLKIITERNPDFISIVGDLVESGGEQRDWDEFWRHIAGEFGSTASGRAIFPAIGNHENYGGPGAFGGYSADAANFGVGKYLTYFEVPPNHATNPRHNGRYYRIDYGPITLITVDSSDGSPDQTLSDTNHNLTGSDAADFNPGTEQYAWLQKQLAEAQESSRFTFVQFHHTPYGSGPHSVLFGTEGFSGQSGIAMRVLRPLFMQYGVDAVFCGHDEMLERSVVPGVESLPGGSERAHEIHFYDAGIGGDGLRGSSANADNPFRRFLAHEDAVEVWEGRRLVSGGKHYGHLEVNVGPDNDGRWKVRIEPVYAFPLTSPEGTVTGWERRIYDDVVEIVSPK